MGPIWGRQDRGGPHVGPMNFAIWVRPVKLIRYGNTHFFHVTLMTSDESFHLLSAIALEMHVRHTANIVSVEQKRNMVS